MREYDIWRHRNCQTPPGELLNYLLASNNRYKQDTSKRLGTKKIALMNSSSSSVFPACSDFHEVDLHGGDERTVNIGIASEIQPR
jgi:hypothetical protein